MPSSRGDARSRRASDRERSARDIRRLRPQLGNRRDGWNECRPRDEHPERGQDVHPRALLPSRHRRKPRPFEPHRTDRRERGLWEWRAALPRAGPPTNGPRPRVAHDHRLRQPRHPGGPARGRRCRGRQHDDGPPRAHVRERQSRVLPRADRLGDRRAVRYIHTAGFGGGLYAPRRTLPRDPVPPAVRRLPPAHPPARQPIDRLGFRHARARLQQDGQRSRRLHRLRALRDHDAAWVVAAMAADQQDFAMRPGDAAPSAFAEIGMLLYERWGT
ncbi:MAG: hypothetical protein QOG50_3407 [Actinomycetota bacterium]|nr:hypothetical protein [Actinomycetota bacterium]